MEGKAVYTAQQHFDARQEMFETYIDDMKNEVFGRNQSILPYITNKNEKVSERKLNKLVQEIMESLFESGMYGIITDSKFKELCECFLYCTINGIAEYNEFDRRVDRPVSFFKDIVEMARHKNNLKYVEKSSLLSGEYETERLVSLYDAGVAKFTSELQQGGFFRSCDIAYSILTSKSIVSTFSEKEYNDLYQAERLEIAQAHGFDTVEEYEKFVSEEYENIDYPEQSVCDDYNDLDDLYSECTDAEHQNTEIRKQKNGKWRNTVSSPEKFIDKYLRFRELFFECSTYYRYMLFEYIEYMVDLFLYNKGLSALSDDKLFSMIYFKTGNLCKNIKNEISRRRT